MYSMYHTLRTYAIYVYVHISVILYVAFANTYLL